MDWLGIGNEKEWGNIGFNKAARLQSLRPRTIKVQKVRLKKFKSKLLDGTQCPKAGFAIQKFIQTETAENKE